MVAAEVPSGFSLDFYYVADRGTYCLCSVYADRSCKNVTYLGDHGETDEVRQQTGDENNEFLTTPE